ncbi:MAG: glycine/sarcosine/betaine reductase selenoprotein B family protein [Thermodesulfobacteriota bacterium]
MDPLLQEFQKKYQAWVEDSLEEFKAQKMDRIVRNYPFLTYPDVPWTPFTGRAKDHKFALLTSGGLYLKDSQPPFDTASIHGDPGFREIPKTVQQKDLGIAHAHFDHRLAEEDINTIFPIQRFVELEQEGEIGALAATNYSFGYVNDVVPLVEESAPLLVKSLREQGVTALFAAPV